MLNHPQAFTRRRIALLGLALLSAAGLAWAAQAASDAAPSAQRVYIQTEIRLGEQVSKTGLITVLGAPATFAKDHGDGSSRWEIVMTVTQEPDGQLRVHTERSFGNPLQKIGGDHDQLDASGHPAKLTMPAPDGGPALAMKRVVSLVPADFKPTR